MAVQSSFTWVFLLVSLLIVFAKVGGEVAKLLRQPAVMGEILSGIIIGPSFLGLVDLVTKSSIISRILGQSFAQEDIGFAIDALALFSEIGLLLLLFEVGLENSFRILKPTAKISSLVALGGMVVPLVAGIVLYLLFFLVFPGLDRKSVV